MEQLIIEGLSLPAVKEGRYQSYEELLSKRAEMASGRMVEEVRGKAWCIEYSCETMKNAMLRELIAALRGSFTVYFLPVTGDEMLSGTFLCTKQPKPSVLFYRQGEPVWHNVSFTLREVTPHA